MNTSFIKERNIFICILLTFVTCGFYGIYWFCSLISTVYALDERTESVGVEILLSFITCGIYFCVVLYKVGQSLNNIARKNNMPTSSNAVLFVILAIFGLGIIDYCIIQEELNTLYRYGVNTTSYPNNTPQQNAIPTIDNSVFNNYSETPVQNNTPANENGFTINTAKNETSDETSAKINLSKEVSDENDDTNQL